MKKILVPTDFSKPSKVAAIYAAHLANKINASITLLSVINASPSEQTLAKWKKMEMEMVKDSIEKADDLMNEIQKSVKGEIKVEYRSVLGFPISQQVEAFVKANGIDLIVMGTKGASGLKKVLMGSNAVEVINESSVPVITVPIDAKFNPITNIVYASDGKHLNREIRKVALFAKALHAHLHVLRVDSPGVLKTELTDHEESLKEKANYSDMDVSILMGEDVVGKLEEYVESKKPQLLVMFTQKMSFLEKLLGTSKTRQFAFQGKTPLLTFNKSTEQFAIMQAWEFDMNFK